MKYLAIMVLFALMIGCGNNSVPDADLTTFNDSVSYSIGADIGKNFKQQGIEVNLNALHKGLADALSEGDLEVSDVESAKILNKFQKEMREKMEAKNNVEAEENKTKGEAFLEENKKQEGVKVTDSGLQYKVIEQGNGPKPKASDKVKVHYKGTLLDGTEFDSSYNRGQPAEFPLSGVIKGWTEGLQLMPVGSKYEFYIPSDLAYGPRGPQTIGPNQTLKFEVELLEIVK
ncbi:MAG: FKBP-type peptidyl-prolyl cis-trans isomerase [Bacteroidota bacterium]